MAWLKNSWYAVAWSDELATTPLGVTLTDEPIVLYRDTNGDVVAIGGRCPHRFAPLAMGVVKGDAIECPYHGLQFGRDGHCAHNPHGDHKIPAKANVPAYPVRDKWSLLWVWPGDAALADERSIPDLSHLVRSDLAHVCGRMAMNSNYMLSVDNLIDLSHAQFVHGDRLASAAFDKAEMSVTQDGNSITNGLSINNSDVPPMFRSFYPPEVTAIDYWLDSIWHPASVVTNDVGVTLPGRPRSEGQRSFGVHIATPCTRNSSVYLFGHSRNYGVHDEAMTQKIRDWQRIGFGEQDKPIIEATARMMGGEVDPLALKAVLLPTDVAAVRARRLLARLIDEEQQGAVRSRVVTIAEATS